MNVSIRKIGIQLVLIFITLLMLNCVKESQSSSKVNVSLSHYQKLVVSPELYKKYLYRDVFEGVIDFNFRKFRIPFIKNGTIKIEEISSTNNILTKTLYFKDSLLTKIQDNNRSNQFLYDEERNLTSNGIMEFSYTDGRLVSKERDLTIHNFEWKGNCVYWEAKDKNDSYISNSEICYNENGKIIKDYSSFVLDKKSITEEFQIQYSVDTIISHTYVRIENSDTTVHHIVSNEINDLGLLGKKSTKVVNDNKIYEKVYKYEISNALPLVISKFEIVDGQKKKEIIYTFNEKGQLTNFRQVGKYGEKYNVIYSET